MEDNELMHYGVLGMKWGVRKANYQAARTQKRVDKLKAKKLAQDRLLRAKNKLNKLKSQEADLKKAVKGKDKQLDGTETKKTDSRAKRSKHKRVKDMTDEELRSKINRLQMEQQYANLTGATAKKGESQVKKWAGDTAKTIMVDTAVDVGKQTVKYFMTKAVNEKLGEEVVYTNNKKK